MRITNHLSKTNTKGAFIMKGLGLLILFCASMTTAFANTNLGKQLYDSRCAVCHGANAQADGPLAQKSNPPTPDLTTAAFQKRLTDYPGVIVASVVLRPNGNLIPNTLRENGIKLPAHTWTADDLRAVNQYMRTLIFKNTETKKPVTP